MASTGTLNTSAYDGRYFEFSWSIKNQDIANNKTTIYWRLTARGSGQYSQYNASPFKITIGTVQIYYSDTRVVTKNGTVIANGEYTLTHNPNGTCSFSVYVQAAVYVYTYNVSGSTTFTMDAIPRIPSIVSAEWENDEAQIKVTYANPSLQLVDKLELNLYPSVGQELILTRTLDKLGGVTNITLNDGERSKVWDAYNASGVTSRSFLLEIVSTIGSDVQKNTYSVSSRIINSAPGISLSYYFDTKTVEKTGANNIPISNFTTVFFELMPTFKKGATLQTYRWTAPITSTATSKTGNFKMRGNTLRFGVTDCRGETTYNEIVFSNYCDYIALSCNQSVRTDWVDETTLMASVDIHGNFYDGNIGSNKNNLELYCRYCEDTQDINTVSWTYVGTAQTKSDGTYSTIHIINGLDYTKGYKIQCSAQDNLTNCRSTVYSSQMLPIFDWSETDFNFNVPVFIDGDLTIRGNVISTGAGSANDYIVEQGTKDGWTYRKWNSGIGECWKTISYTTTVTGVWGSLYQSGYIARQNYPFSFTDKPVETVSCVAGSGGGWTCPADAANGGTNGASASAVYLILRPTAATTYQTYYINYQVMGKWK